MLSIESYIQKKQTFVLYHLPEEEHSYFISNDEGADVYEHITDIKEQQGFAFAPFHAEDATPIYFIQGTPQKLFVTASSHHNLHITPILTKEQEFQQYTEHFTTFKRALEEKRFSKLVLSRKSDYQIIGEVPYLAIFSSIVEQYPTAFASLFYHPHIGCWIGASPEILLTSVEGQGHTIALAGTQPWNTSIVWSDKNKREQEYVSQHIRQALQQSNICYQESAQHTVQAGNLAHIRTDFHFTLPPQQAEALVDALHPTPAVCGLPNKEAKQFILHEEGYQRTYYAGFLGVMNQNKSNHLYVNLRCASIKDDILSLYAGGGLIQDSSLEEEWKETERKMETIKNALLS